MPTLHRRVALTVDQPLDDALRILRRDSATPEARLARRAVLDGALVELLLDAVASGRSTSTDPAAVLSQVVGLSRQLGIPETFIEGLDERLAAARSASAGRERHARQLALLRPPEDQAELATAADLADTFEAFGLE